MGSYERICGAATLLHVIDAVRGEQVANCYLEKMRTIRSAICKLSGMAKALRKMNAHASAHLCARVQLQGLKKDVREAFKNAPYMWLSEQKQCFVVRFAVPGKVDHMVCIDG